MGCRRSISSGCEIPASKMPSVFFSLICHTERGTPNSGVVAPGRTYDVELVMQQLIEEFLYDRLSVATGDADHGDVELLPVVSRQLL